MSPARPRPATNAEDMRHLVGSTSESDRAPGARGARISERRRGNMVLVKSSLLLVGASALLLCVSVASGMIPRIKGRNAVLETVVSKFLDPKAREMTGACTPMPSGDGVSSDCAGITQGQSCTVQCGPGYTGASESYTCEPSGAFAGTPMACIAQPCSMTSFAASHTSDCAGKTTSQTCDAKCATGYWGNDTIYVCTTTSVFVPISGTHACEALPCHTGEPTGAGATHDCIGKTTGESCTVSCDAGFKPNPPTPTNVTMACANTGKFTGSPPVCVAQPCTLAAPGADSTNDCTDKVTGQTCKSSCADGFFGTPVEHTCDPATGDFSAGAPTCTACGTDCNKCTSATACTECKNSKYLYGSSCVDDCSAATGTYDYTGTGGVGNECKKCPTGCTHCTASACTACESNKFLKEGTCVDACPAGYATVSNTCQKCATNCNLCTKAIGGCTECKNSKYLWEGFCIAQCPADEGTYGSGEGTIGRLCKIGTAPAAATPAPPTPTSAPSPSSSSTGTSLCAHPVAWGACFSALTAGKKQADIATLCDLVRQTSPLPANVSPDVEHLRNYYVSATSERPKMDHALDSTGHCPKKAP